jgi:hypothetical protein
VNFFFKAVKVAVKVDVVGTEEEQKRFQAVLVSKAVAPEKPTVVRRNARSNNATSSATKGKPALRYVCVVRLILKLVCFTE